MVFLLVSLVSAGEIRQIDIENDFVDKNGLIITVKEQEGIEFNMFDGRHILTIDKIHRKGVDVNAFLFVDGDQKTTYITLSSKRTLKLDLNRDGIGDLFVGFKEFLSEDQAKLVLFYPGQENKGEEISEITGEVVASTPKDINYITWYFGITLAILILALISVLISKRKVKADDKANL